MSRDLKALFERERQRKHEMPRGHEARFEARLDAAFGKKRPRAFFWVGMAASLLALAGLFFWQAQRGEGLQEAGTPLASEPHDSTRVSSPFSLGDLSPDLQKLEQYYTTSINLELASLEIPEEDREVAEGFIGRLSELDAEYHRLNRELNELGPNEQTITAMIRNLQYRLSLLLKLKEKLSELKTSKNETVETGSI